MKEKKYRFTFNAPVEVDLNPLIYNDVYFDDEITLESDLFYELRKGNNIRPYRLSDSDEIELSHIKYFFNEHKKSFFFLYENKEIIGSILIINNYIQSLCINRHFQRMGYGKKLVAYVINHAYNTGYRSLELSILSGNQTAELFYKSIGFSPVN